MQKRDPKTRKYKPYKIPSNWFTPLMCFDMDKPVNCASCWVLHTFGTCYTSRRIHNNIGLGYPVCTECYNKEFDDIKAMGEND